MNRFRKGLGLLLAWLFALVLVWPGRALAEDVASPGVFRVGMEVNYAPFNWTQTGPENGGYEIANSPGEFANGYDLQMAKKIADGLGLELEIVKIEWDGLIPALQSGKIDAIIAGMSPTEERKKEIDFSDTYYSSDLVLVVQKGSPYEGVTSLEDLAGAQVTGQLNTFHYDVVDQIPGVDKVDPMDTFSTMILNTKSGKVDGYVSEKPGALSAVAANNDLTFVEFDPDQGFDTSAEETSIAVGLRKGSGLAGDINQVLEGISQEERDALMDQAVQLQLADEGVDDSRTGFWQDIKDIAREYRPLFIRGIITTMALALVSTCVGFLIGLVVAVIRNAQVNRRNRLAFGIKRLVDFVLAFYVELFRGTPMMVQAILMYYGPAYLFGIDTNAMVTAFVVVSINTGAYLAEVVRGGINSIDPGQFEACKAIGMTHGQGMVNVILPQVIRNILPSIGNEFVINIKDTSVLSVISVTELFFMARSVSGTTNKYFQTYIIVLVIYFILTFVVTRILSLVEKRMFGKATFVMESSTGGRADG